MSFLLDHILSLLIFFPLVAAGIVVLLPTLSAARSFSMVASLLALGLTIVVWIEYDPASLSAENGFLAFVEDYAWMPQFGIRYIVGIDGLSLLLVVLTGFLVPLVFLSQWHIDSDNQKVFLSLILFLQSAMFGALLALDLVFWYVFWEAMLIPMYFIVGVWGGKKRIYATTKFVIYTVAGSLLMLIAAIVLYFEHIKFAGFPSSGLGDLYLMPIDPETQIWLFAAFALAFAIKIPLWPFHTWLPDAHVEAPTAGSVILAGILLKMGTYGFLRFAIPLFPQAAVALAPYLIGLGVTGIIYGALIAWMQSDAKKLVAYSSVSHLGFIVVGSLAFLSDNTISEVALTGAVYQMVNHGVSTGALFFLVGLIYERRHTRMLKDFGGLAAVMPWFATILIVATLSSVGLPGTGGFVGEFLILIGLFQSSPFAAILSSLGVLLGAVYMLTLCKAILFGPCDKQENQVLRDLSPREFGYLVPLAVLCILMGVYPKLFLDKVQPSVHFLAKDFASYRLRSIESDSSNTESDWTLRKY